MITTTRLSELTGDYVLDTARTRIGFVARHTMATKVPGQFGEFEGTAHLDGDDPPKSSAQLTITAESIQTRNQAPPWLMTDIPPAQQETAKGKNP